MFVFQVTYVFLFNEGKVINFLLEKEEDKTDGHGQFDQSISRCMEHGEPDEDGGWQKIRQDDRIATIDRIKPVTYVYPVQSSTWSDPWLTAATSHSVHWSAERSMAAWHNPSTQPPIAVAVDPFLFQNLLPLSLALYLSLSLSLSTIQQQQEQKKKKMDSFASSLTLRPRSFLFVSFCFALLFQPIRKPSLSASHDWRLYFQRDVFGGYCPS